MNSWEKALPDEIVKVGWRTLVRKTFVRPDGETAEYITKEAPGARSGAVIALTPEKKVIVAEQFRPGPEKIMQELPGGGIKVGEDAKKAVMRELLEETGYTSEEVECICTSHKDAYTNAEWHFYIALDCRQVREQELDEGEFVNVKLITIEELFDNARNARMTDTSAMFFAYDRLMQLNKER